MPKFEVTVERVELYSTVIEIEAADTREAMKVARSTRIPETQWQHEGYGPARAVGVTEIKP